MKKILLLFCLHIFNIVVGQTFSTNLTPVGWEHNILFNAASRYTVTQQGPAVDIPALFDGAMFPSYSSTGISSSSPAVILIEGLPLYHTQAGAWVGWTTRYLPAKRFKIEGYDANTWKIIADYSSVDYNNFNFSVRIPIGGVYTKLKYTFYEGDGSPGYNGVFGLSELFFILPEATSPYAGLLASSVNSWQNNGANLNYKLGNVGIGVTNPNNKLDVNGTIHAKEVKVDMQGWSDFVFKKEYDLPTLEEVEKHIKETGHLQNIPSEEEVLKNGIYLGDMNTKLLQKIEELTLYVIEQEKKTENLITIIEKQNKRLEIIEKHKKN